MLAKKEFFFNGMSDEIFSDPRGTPLRRIGYKEKM
jgi:hypothetical protein